MLVVISEPGSIALIRINKYMADSPTKRSLKKLREEGYLCQVVEHWNPFARVRQDLFGFIDIVAIKDGVTLGVQTTTRANINARVVKIRWLTAYPIVKASGWKVVCHGWSKLKNDRWDCKVIEL